jgi:hypothetical protein
MAVPGSVLTPILCWEHTMKRNFDLLLEASSILMVVVLTSAAVH